MTAETETETERRSIVCGEVMDIASVAEFHIPLMEALALKQDVELDASQVERVDTAALQMLSCFVQDAHAQQKSVHWRAPSDVFCYSAALLGLSDLLNLEKNSENYQQEALGEIGVNSYKENSNG